MKKDSGALLQAVLAHELGHLKCDHGVWLSLANIFANGTASVLPVISGAVEESLLRQVCLHLIYPPESKPPDTTYPLNDIVSVC